MRVREKTNFFHKNVKYHISKVLHLTTGKLSEVQFEMVHHPFTHYKYNGDDFLKRVGYLFPDETENNLTDLQRFFATDYKAAHPATPLTRFNNKI